MITSNLRDYLIIITLNLREYLTVKASTPSGDLTSQPDWFRQQQLPFINSKGGKVMSTLLEAINNAVVTSNSFYGQFSYIRDTTGGIESVVVSVSEGQGNGTPTKGSGVIAIEKKSKLQVLELVEQVGTKQSMGVNFTLWTFVNLTQQLRK